MVLPTHVCILCQGCREIATVFLHSPARYMWLLFLMSFLATLWPLSSSLLWSPHRTYTHVTVHVKRGVTCAPEPEGAVGMCSFISTQETAGWSGVISCRMLHNSTTFAGSADQELHHTPRTPGRLPVAAELATPPWATLLFNLHQQKLSVLTPADLLFRSKGLRIKVSFISSSLVSGFHPAFFLTVTHFAHCIPSNTYSLLCAE